MGTINPGSDEDFFKFSAQEGTTYTIEVVLDTHTDTILGLYDSRGRMLAQNDDASFQNQGSLLVWTAPSTGDYFLKVSSFNTFSQGSYKLVLEVTSTSTALSGIYFGSETSSVDGTSAEFLLDIQESNGVVTGLVDIPQHFSGSASIAYGDFTGEKLFIQTYFYDGGDEWECYHFGDRQPDRQTVAGDYECYLVGGSTTDYGSWSVTRIDSQ